MLSIGHQISQSRGLKLDVYHINSKSLARLEEASEEDVQRNVPDPTMTVLALKPLSTSQHLAVQEEMKPSQGSRWEMTGYTLCLLVVLSWHYSKEVLFICPLSTMWGVATTAPWKKRKKKRATNRKPIHPNQRKVNSSYCTTSPPLKSDTMERVRVKLCDAGYDKRENTPSPIRYFFHWCWHHFNFHISVC